MASLARLAEHALRKRMVAGSIPTWGLSFGFFFASGRRLRSWLARSRRPRTDIQPAAPGGATEAGSVEVENLRKICQGKAVNRTSCKAQVGQFSRELSRPENAQEPFRKGSTLGGRLA